MNKGAWGDFLEKVRNEKGYTQEQLAQMLGVSVCDISQWENGCTIPLDKLLPLCNILEISVNELMAGQRINLPPEIDKNDTVMSRLIKRLTEKL